MMPPDDKAQNRDRHAGKCHEVIAENTFSGKTCDDFAYYSHARQNHDVHGRMGIEPEQVLEENGISADIRVKDAYVRDTLKGEQQERNRQHGPPGVESKKWHSWPRQKAAAAT